jgi:FixJ family two-component response regulator
MRSIGDKVIARRSGSQVFRSSETRIEMMERSTVYILDDDFMMQDTLVALLSSHGYSVRTFTHPDDFLSLPKVNSPACLILDLDLGTTDALALQQRLTGDAAMPVIFLSGIVDIPTTVKAMRGGASEFLLKPVDEEQILSAVRVALRQAREQWKDRQQVRQIRKRYETLTQREREVLPYVVRGYLNKQTAYELGTSDITIRIHRGQIMRKMNASSLAELVWLAGRLGIPDRSTIDWSAG